MNILFIDTTHPVLPELLEAAGHNCEHFNKQSLSALENEIGKYEGIIIRSKFMINRALLIKAKKLKFIGRVGAGMENIDLDFAEERGIICFNAPEGNRDAVGEQALGMLLALNNKLLIADAQVRKGMWKREENRGVEIHGKTVGIIGYGNMGFAFAKRLSGFGAEVIAYDKYKNNYGDAFVREATMKELFERADIISLHVPLTEETNYLVDEVWIEHFKKSIILINTSRGKVVKTSALVCGLKTNKIVGACLDVLEYEKTSFENLFQQQLPEDFEYLVESDKVILSPHIAGWTHESNRKLAEVLVAKITQRFAQ